jgi:hypothetical protein
MAVAIIAGALAFGATRIQLARTMTFITYSALQRHGQHQQGR